MPQVPRHALEFLTSMSASLRGVICAFGPKMPLVHPSPCCGEDRRLGLSGLLQHFQLVNVGGIDKVATPSGAPNGAAARKKPLIGIVCDIW